MAAIKHSGHKRFGVTYGPDFMFVKADDENEALRFAHIKFAERYKEKNRKAITLPKDLQTLHQFKQIATVSASVRD